MTAIAPAGARSIRVGRATYPLILPTWRDPRLHIAAVTISLQVLGQTSLHFDLSIAQILTAVLTSALLDLVIVFATRRTIAWPASALLTGNGVAFILRVPGTHHGDWWSMRGAWIFAATAAVSLVSKYLIRYRGRHLFNPSNIGLVLCFLLLGSSRADPLDFWWGNMSLALAAALAIIVIGGLMLAGRLHMLGMVVSFWIAFAASVGVVALSGHSMTARWHVGPISGGFFWSTLVISPEILLFLFFMITDPRTTPEGRAARVVYGSAVGVLAALLAAPQRTEFATKVAVLGSLAIVCAARPLLERGLPVVRSYLDRVGNWARGGVALGSVAVFGSALVFAGLPARPDARPSTGADHHAVASTLHLPPVDLDPNVHTIDTEVDQPKAKRIARAFVADLGVLADAIRTRDRLLVPQGAAGPRFNDIDLQVQKAIAGKTVAVPSYELERITVLVVRSQYQAGPQLGIDVQGTLRTTRYRAGQPTSAAGPARRFHRTFSLLTTPRGYKIYADATRT